PRRRRVDGALPLPRLEVQGLRLVRAVRRGRRALRAGGPRADDPGEDERRGYGHGSFEHPTIVRYPAPARRISRGGPERGAGFATPRVSGQGALGATFGCTCMVSGFL